MAPAAAPAVGVVDDRRDEMAMSERWEPARPVDTKAFARRFPGVVAPITANDKTTMAAATVTGLGPIRPHTVRYPAGSVPARPLRTTDIEAQTRRCSDCGRWQPLTAFPANVTELLGRGRCCRGCTADRQRAYRATLHEARDWAMTHGWKSASNGEPATLRDRLRKKRRAEAVAVIAQEAAG